MQVWHVMLVIISMCVCARSTNTITLKAFRIQRFREVEYSLEGKPSSLKGGEPAAQLGPIQTKLRYLGGMLHYHGQEVSARCRRMKPIHVKTEHLEISKSGTLVY